MKAEALFKVKESEFLNIIENKKDISESIIISRAIIFSACILSETLSNMNEEKNEKEEG